MIMMEKKLVLFSYYYCQARSFFLRKSDLCQFSYPWETPWKTDTSQIFSRKTGGPDTSTKKRVQYFFII